jgi:hypothetical protein
MRPYVPSLSEGRLDEWVLQWQAKTRLWSWHACISHTLYGITLGDIMKPCGGYRSLHSPRPTCLPICRTGDLYCNYHGWAFNGSGKCTSIPQLSPEQREGPQVRQITRRPTLVCPCPPQFTCCMFHTLHVVQGAAFCAFSHYLRY